MNVINFLQTDEILEPETLKSLFPEYSEKDLEKLQVIRLLLKTNVVYEDMDVFENAVQVFNNIKPDIDKTEGCKPEWIWYALEKMKKLNSNKLSFEVQQYIKWNFNQEGLYFYPPESDIKENTKLKDIIYLANKGPFPLKEDFFGIQAYKYLRIQEYIDYARRELN